MRLWNHWGSTLVHSGRSMCTRNRIAWVSAWVYRNLMSKLRRWECRRQHMHKDEKAVLPFWIEECHWDNRIHAPMEDWKSKLNQHYTWIATKTNFANDFRHSQELSWFIASLHQFQGNFQTLSTYYRISIDLFRDVFPPYTYHQKYGILFGMWVQHENFSKDSNCDKTRYQDAWIKVAKACCKGQRKNQQGMDQIEEVFLVRFF